MIRRSTSPGITDGSICASAASDCACASSSASGHSHSTALPAASAVWSTSTATVSFWIAPLALTLTPAAAQTLFGGPLDGVAAGTPSKPFTLALRFVDTPRIDRNVLARLPGADPTLRGQYIALGAHADHIGGNDAVSRAGRTRAGGNGGIRPIRIALRMLR